MSHEYIDSLIPERLDPKFWEKPEIAYLKNLPKISADGNNPNDKLEREISIRVKKNKATGYP